ncbi:putative (E)-beta-ocimene synthase [Helianthus anomalus]
MFKFNTMEHMPKYLQLGFGALFDTISEMGCITSNAPEEDITPILQSGHEKYIPTLEDYLDNAWRSVSGVVILTHGYLLINEEINKDVIDTLEKYHDLMKWSSMVFRLYNDLATYSNEMQRGKNVNVISCYMHESGACEEVARVYLKTLIDQAWRKLIKVHLACSRELANPFIDMAINLARISCCTYQYVDGHGAPDARAKDRVLSVIIEPIAIGEY